MKILRLQNEYMESVAILAHKLWPSNSIQELVSDISHILSSRLDCVLICIQKNRAIGFAHVSLRNDYAEGTHSSPVAYIEGIFIEKDFRHRGYANRLVDGGIDWAKKQGCTEAEILYVPDFR